MISDDLGSGWSSFAYLKPLPVNYLKIEGVLAKDIVEDQVDLAMVRPTNDVCWESESLQNLWKTSLS